jgi:hypothetical protein
MSYLDEPTGALVRPYTITGGRTRPLRQITFEALIGTTVEGRLLVDHRHDIFRYEPYHVTYIANACRVRSHSLAEIAAYMRLPLGVVRVVVADMAIRGLVTVQEPLPFDDPAAPHILERVLVGLRAL